MNDGKFQKVVEWMSGGKGIEMSPTPGVVGGGYCVGVKLSRARLLRATINIQTLDSTIHTHKKRGNREVITKRKKKIRLHFDFMDDGSESIFGSFSFHGRRLLVIRV